ncbi:hypothetical protein H6775_01435 [Candidatus Nomurabacteria bacterium]|nr:hypothetical protein [Candidatus Nomurabacteria bacterium]
MISIEKCREILGEKADKLSDEQIKKIRGALYHFIEKEIDKWFLKNID